MIKLTPKRFEKIWGYEDWICSTHKNYIQEDFYSKFNQEYPLLLKIIKANDFLSVQVHPDDEMAKILETKNDIGKTECWFVLDADENSSLVYGFKKNFSVETIKSSLENKNFESLLNIQKVKKGDFIFIPAGTVHAIGSGLTLLEIQQSCDITYRFFDWNRGRELHIEKSIKAIKNNNLEKISTFSGKFSCSYFSLEKLNVHGGYSVFVSGKNEIKNSIIIYALNGKGIIKDSDKNVQKIQEGDTFALFPGEKITVEGQLELMKVYSF